MGFDLGRFEGEQYKSREMPVPVPELASFFADGTDPVWVVRGLTGIEVAQARDAKRRAQDMEAIIGKLAAGASREKADAVMEALGVAASTMPDDYIQRVSLLVHGSVNPAIRRDHAVKVAEVAPLTFYRLTDEIYKLTGQGKSPESSASGTSPESGQASPSVPEADSEGAGSDSFMK